MLFILCFVTDNKAVWIPIVRKESYPQMSSPILSPASAWGLYRLLSLSTSLSEIGFTWKGLFEKLTDISSDSRSRCRTCCICPRRRRWGTRGRTTSCWRQRAAPRAWRCHPSGSGKKGRNGMQHLKKKSITKTESPVSGCFRFFPCFPVSTNYDEAF